jgi:hypothetical protein
MTISGALQTRVRRLEGAGGRECLECGFDGDWSKVRPAWVPRSASEASRNRYCGTCGRPTHIVLTWGGDHA